MIELILAVAAASYMAQSGCVQVAHDRILLSDITPAVPALSSRPAGSQFIGWTPVPGSRRTITSRELLRTTRREGLALSEGDVRDVCVERAVAPLNATEIGAALSRVPEVAGAEIEIVDFSRVNVPAGRLEFSISGLGRP